MAKVAISEILKKCAELSKKDQRVEALRQNANEPIKIILQLMYHPDAKFLLPEGEPPYKPSQFDEVNMLYTETKRLYLFLEGSSPASMSQVKRENLFIQMLEAVTPDDAKLLLAMKDKKAPYKGLTKEIVTAAFPELFPT